MVKSKQVMIIHYHGGWVVGFGRCPVADVAKVVEEEEPHHPEEATDNEHHHHQARVQGAVHLQRELLSSLNAQKYDNISVLSRNAQKYDNQSVMRRNV